MEKRKQKERKLKHDDLHYARIGERYWKCTRQQIPEGCSYKKYITSYIEGIVNNIAKGNGLLLKGPYSSGKTGSAVIILKAAIAHRKTALFLAARDICSMAINNQMFDNETKQTVLDRAETVDLLLIDDLGDEAETKSEFVPAKIEGLLRTRSDRKKSTIVTTNLSTKQIEQRYGKSTLQVMRGCVFPVEVSGVNWRDNEAENLKDSFN